MKKSIFLFILSGLSFCFLVQCKKDKVETSQSQNNNNACDTSNVNYTKIATILNANSCTNCHSASASIPLDTYDNVKSIALSGRLIGAVEHLSGYKPMPNSNQKISECDRNTIKAWINQGTKS